ncbi:MAG: transcriptional regulator [Myxococcota bacterium]
MRPPGPDVLAELLRCARRHARVPDEAEDLLQTVLIAAMEAGRDPSNEADLAWVKGALRNRAAFEARTAVRRRNRDAEHAPRPSEAEPSLDARGFVDTLPPTLKTTAQLALTGHTKAEIQWLLNVSDAALRQRITQIRKRWRGLGGRGGVEMSGLGGDLAYGAARRALLRRVDPGGVALATHDPDGNLIVLRSQNAGARQPGGYPKREE